MSAPMPRDPLVKSQATGNATYVMRALRQIYRDGYSSIEQHLLKRLERCFEACLLQHPIQNATMRQVALHEAGHLIAFEVEGMGAACATIHGSAFGRYGWGGSANCFNSRLDGLGLYSPDNLLSEARASLAGPLAEAALGDGNILASIGELFEVHILTAHAAEMLGRDRLQVLADTVERTAAIIAVHAEQIGELATSLMHRRRITRYDQDCAETLSHVRKTPMDARSVRQRRTAIPRLEELEQLVKRPCPYRETDHVRGGI